MQLAWSFCNVGIRWELVLIDLDKKLYSGGKMNIVYSPGYVSRKASDIIDAMLYLNTGDAGRLPPRALQALDQIRKTAPASGNCNTAFIPELRHQL